jgi:hypothetical protein
LNIHKIFTLQSIKLPLTFFHFIQKKCCNFLLDSGIYPTKKVTMKFFIAVSLLAVVVLAEAQRPVQLPQPQKAVQQQLPGQPQQRPSQQQQQQQQPGKQQRLPQQPQPVAQKVGPLAGQQSGQKAGQQAGPVAEQQAGQQAGPLVGQQEGQREGQQAVPEAVQVKPAQPAKPAPAAVPQQSGQQQQATGRAAKLSPVCVDLDKKIEPRCNKAAAADKKKCNDCILAKLDCPVAPAR